MATLFQRMKSMAQTITGAWTFTPAVTLTGGAILGTATVAAAGSNSQANATALASPLNIVTTVSATTRAVRLPAAEAGKVVQIMNAAATAVKVYPATGDKIASASTNAVGAAIAAGKGNIYVGQDAQTWRLLVGA